jgi:beta-glucanase (GH16 family)
MSITNDNTLTLTGTAAANSTVKVYDGATLLGTAAVNGSGAWSYTTGTLLDAIHSFTATDTDAAGNFSAPSPALAVAVDMVAPGQPVDSDDGQTLTLRGHQTTDFSAADFWTGIDLSHFQLTFADEFDSFDWSPDGSHGWRTTLDWGNRTLPTNNEAQYYSDASVGVDPFYLHDGVLDITATAGSNPLGLPYNSGVITTQDSFSQLYGYFEMRAQLPAGAGLWPTFSLLPADHSWPPELDVFEVLGSDPTTAVVTVHSASTGAHTMVASAVATADLSEGFHTFGVNWEPDIIQWYIDGVEVAEAPTPPDMHQPMYLLANLAVGGAGSWPGVADPSAFPATMSINYIRVYQSLEQQGALASNSAAASVNDAHASNGLEGVTHPAIVDDFGSPMHGLLGGARVAYHGDLII